MPSVELPPPVKMILAALWSDRAALEQAVEWAEEVWGPADYAGPDRLFDVTSYYEPEMGKVLYRRLMSFSRLAPSESLIAAKLTCNHWERQLTRNGGRRVNLDVGYLDQSKVVLASVKCAGQKIHLGQGVYADMIARYRGGAYQPFEWTFPDFAGGRYDEELSAIRRRYLDQRKAATRGRSPT